MSNDLRVNLIGDASKLNASLNKASSKLKAFGKSATKIGMDLSMKLTLPIGLAAGAAIKLASDFQETESKFNTVFSSIQGEAQKTAETFKESFGLSSLAAKDMLSSTGDLLVGFGFAEQEALNLSDQVNSLAVDLASFTNFSGGAKGASEALTKALLGERESIKSLGIAITEADLKTFAAEQGLVFKEMDRVAKATLTYQLALKQSQKAVGDFGRTQDSFANQFRQLQGDLSDLAVDIGNLLIPAALKIVKVFRSAIKRFEGLDKKTKKIIIGVGLLAAAIGPILVAIGAMSSVVGFAITGFTTLTGVLTILKGGFIRLTIAMMANPFVAIATAVVVLTGYIVSLANKMAPLISKWETFKNIIKSGGKFSKFAALQLASQQEAQRKLDEETKNNIDTKDKETISLDKNTKAVEDNNNAKQRNKVGTANAGLGVKPVGVEAIVGLAKSGTDPATQLADSIGKGNILLQGKLLETRTLLTESQREYLNNADMFNQQLGGIFESGLENLAVGIGDALGQAIATGGSLGSKLSVVLLSTLGGVATQIGKMAIGIGIALEGIKKALQSLNPFVAIAAGIALVALGSFFQSKSSQIASNMGGGPKAFAKGGIVSTPTLGLVGEYTGARSNPEVIAPLDKLKNMIGDRGSSQVQVAGQFTLKGQDLVVALQRADRNRNRIK